MARRRRDFGSSRAVPALRVALGERLRAIRHARSFSQERLGQGAGLSGKFIGEVERGDKSVSLDSLYRIAKVLKVSLAELVEPAERGRGKRRANA
jgi:transcriptional regulator with XRE-family HTH domain